MNKAPQLASEVRTVAHCEAMRITLQNGCDNPSPSKAGRAAGPRRGVTDLRLRGAPERETGALRCGEQANRESLVRSFKTIADVKRHSVSFHTFILVTIMAARFSSILRTGGVRLV